MDPFNFITHFGGGVGGYVVVIGLLLLCGLGVPVPEDIILISGGYLSHEAGHTVWPMVVTGLFGIIAGDSIIFSFGRRFGRSMAQRTFLRRVVTEDRLARVDGLFKKYGQVIISAARFMPGVRAVTFFTSGAIRVPYWKFVLFDGLAALISAPLWTILGYRYGHEVVARARHYQRWIFFVLGMLLGAYVVYAWLSSRRQMRRDSAPSLAAVVVDPAGSVAPVAADAPSEPLPAPNERH